MIIALKEILRDVAADPAFAVCAAVAIVSALLMITRRSPVYSALWLMVCFISIAVVFLKLQAVFLAAIHVLVYTGAILVLFLFVIMLLNLQPHELGTEPKRLPRMLAAIACGLTGGVLGLAVLKGTDGPAPFRPIGSAQWGGVEHVGTVLFERFVFPFEIVSVLIVVAILGAVVLAKRKL